MVAPMLDLRVSDIVRGRSQRMVGPWRLLFVGRVERLKGIGELLEAASQLCAAGVQVELDIIGWSLEFEHYRGEAKRLGLSAARFHGVVMDRDRLRRFYEQADLLVLPTHTDGFPRVLYEAMAYGLPILTTFVGGIPAVMRDRVNCLEVPLRDATGLAARLQAAIADPELRSRISEGGVRTVSEVLGAGRPTHAQTVADQLADGGALSER
jgi:glycosyltransferase involved in cell wall biosynthesis